MDELEKELKMTDAEIISALWAVIDDLETALGPAGEDITNDSLRLRGLLDEDE